jgi:signal transduction histidine kinase
MTTIKQQLTRKLLLALGLLLGLGGLGVYASTRAALLEQFDATLRAKAMAIAVATQQEDGRITLEVPERFMHEFEGRSGVDLFQMWRQDGTTFRRSPSLGGSDLPRNQGIRESQAAWNLTLPAGIEGRAIGLVFSPHVSREEGEDRRWPAPSPLTLVVASDRRGLDVMLTTLAAVLTGCGGVLMVGTSLVVPRLLRRELMPLDRLADQASRIDADSLASRFPTTSLPGELMPIGQRFNDLLARLERSFDRERQFSADLAHELRTPIAELRSLAEISLKWPETRETQADRDALGIAVQMEGIVDRLLTLLRCDRGLLPFVPQRLTLGVELTTAGRPFVARAAQKQLVMSWDVPADASIESDPVLIRSIVANLIENAVEYTPDGGSVRVQARVEAQRFVVLVSNTVSGLSENDVGKLFDRFWRQDAARTGDAHSGLGLSLARAFGRALGCELTAALELDSRLTLTLSGPVKIVMPVA